MCKKIYNVIPVKINKLALSSRSFSALMSSLFKTLGTHMHVIMDIMVSPSGVGISVSPYVAHCQKVFQEAGLNHQMHSYGTNVEGEWDDVMAAVRRCHDDLHAMGAVRITSHMKLGTRVDREQTMQDKIDSVNEKLGA